MALDDYTSSSRKVDHSTTRKILQIIASNKASYPSEIKRETNIDRETIEQTLYDLKSSGIIERLHPKMKNSDQRLLERRQDMWARGITGINSNNGQFNKLTWFGLDSTLEWYLKTNEGFYVDEYHQRVVRPSDSKSAMDYIIGALD